MIVTWRDGQLASGAPVSRGRNQYAALMSGDIFSAWHPKKQAHVEASGESVHSDCCIIDSERAIRPALCLAVMTAP